MKFETAVAVVFFYITRPVAGGGAGGVQAPPEIFRLELIFAIKVEFLY